MGLFARFKELFRKPKFEVNFDDKETDKKWRRRGARKLSIITEDNVKASIWMNKKKKYQ